MTVSLSEKLRIAWRNITEDRNKQFDDAVSRLTKLEATMSAIEATTTAIDGSILQMKDDVRTSLFQNWASDKHIVSPVYGGASDRIVTVMRALSPLDVRDRGFRRVGRELDGGYVMIDDFSMAKAAISCGIEDETSWDREMAELGLVVHQFDHTVDRPPEENPRFRFNKLAIRASSSEDGITLEQIAEELGDDAKGAILKLDIERSEWHVLEAIDESTLSLFSQVLVEFHDLHYMPIFIDAAEEIARKLARNFFVTHVHANNHEECYSLGGVIVPRVIEVTFANREWFQPAPLTRSFPTDLDRRNDPRRPELHLGKFAY